MYFFENGKNIWLEFSKTFKNHPKKNNDAGKDDTSKILKAKTNFFKICVALGSLKVKYQWNSGTFLRISVL